MPVIGPVEVVIWLATVAAVLAIPIALVVVGFRLGRRPR